jgi:hypothetical protein
MTTIHHDYPRPRYAPPLPPEGLSALGSATEKALGEGPSIVGTFPEASPATSPPAAGNGVTTGAASSTLGVDPGAAPAFSRCFTCRKGNRAKGKRGAWDEALVDEGFRGPLWGSLREQAPVDDHHTTQHQSPICLTRGLSIRYIPTRASTSGFVSMQRSSDGT